MHLFVVYPERGEERMRYRLLAELEYVSRSKLKLVGRVVFRTQIGLLIPFEIAVKRLGVEIVQHADVRHLMRKEDVSIYLAVIGFNYLPTFVTTCADAEAEASVLVVAGRFFRARKAPRLWLPKIKLRPAFIFRRIASFRGGAYHKPEARRRMELDETIPFAQKLDGH